MNVFRIYFACAVAVFTPALCMAQDDEKPESPLPSHLPLKTEICFGRVYDAAHLAAHPRQRITSFHLAREFNEDPNLEFDPTPEEKLKEYDGDEGRINVRAYVRFRNKKGVYSNGVVCGTGGGTDVYCSIDCDGGSFKLKPSRQSLLLENNGFVVVGGCGASEDKQENEEYVSPSADDKTFRLDPKPFAACTAERTAIAPAWVKLGRPLRFRFKENETFCLSRSYDAAHLAAHPKQTIKRITILTTPDSQADPGFWEYNFTFRIETRNGKKFEQKTRCSPDQYAYGCQPPRPNDSDRSFYLMRAGDSEVMLRDKHGLLAKVFKTKLGSDDRVFRLRAGPAEACQF